jgi:hypothetical protein
MGIGMSDDTFPRNMWYATKLLSAEVWVFKLIFGFHCNLVNFRLRGCKYNCHILAPMLVVSSIQH